MAAGVRALLSLSLTSSLAGADVGGGRAGARATMEFSMEVQPGNAALDVANLMYHAAPQIAASGNLDLDLLGSLVSPIGSSFGAAEIVLIAIKAKATNVNDVVLGGAGATNDFIGPFSADGTVRIQPGMMMVFPSRNGWPVVAGTGDILRLANSGAGSAVDLEILILARSTVG